MELFKGQSLLEFTERFKTDLDCEEYLASLKWEDGYCCHKCGHKKYQVRKDFSHTCNICGNTESNAEYNLHEGSSWWLRNAPVILYSMAPLSISICANDKSAMASADERVRSGK